MAAEGGSSEGSSSDSSDDDSMDDLELLLLQNVFCGREFDVHLNFEDISEDDFPSLFRFQKHDFVRLVNGLKLPDFYFCQQRSVCPGTEALLILLRRLSYPNRWCDLTHMFGRPEPELSMIFNEILTDIHRRFGHLLHNLDLVWLDPQAFAEAIFEKGSPLRDCWGFIDGTARPICRPIRNQKIMFSGHKRTHCVKFQSVITPNGLICHLFGPLEGRRHDAFMLHESGLLQELARKMNKANGDPYVIYGDPAYPVRRHILAPFRGAQLTPAEQNFNAAMSAVRTSVEWGYGKIIKYFAFLDFSKNMKVLLQPVGKLYIVAALLVNCHTCLYGSQTTQFFAVDAPELETYLNNC
ncbi:uncharacterized protein LOC141893231 isoform X2 [Acropora palmata]